MLLYETPWSDDAKARLSAMAESEDGFLLAERDLALRGPGDVFGTRQSGVPLLRAGDPIRDADLLEQAHAEARGPGRGRRRAGGAAARTSPASGTTSSGWSLVG